VSDAGYYFSKVFGSPTDILSTFCWGIVIFYMDLARFYLGEMVGHVDHCGDCGRHRIAARYCGVIRSDPGCRAAEMVEARGRQTLYRPLEKK
jgi:hypothetical protein